MAQEEQPTILVGYVCNARLQYSSAYFHDHYLLPSWLSVFRGKSGLGGIFSMRSRKESCRERLPGAALSAVATEKQNLIRTGHH